MERIPQVLYIHYMSNLSNESLSNPERAFVEGVAGLMIPWGVPPAAARLHGYLLLKDHAVSLDRISRDLEMSKSGTSVAARLLESYTLIRRVRERGTKRALYEISDNYEGMLAGEQRLLAALVAQFRTGADTVATGRAARRLGELAEFYTLVGDAMETALRQWRDTRRLAGGPQDTPD